MTIYAPIIAFNAYPPLWPLYSRNVRSMMKSSPKHDIQPRRGHGATLSRTDQMQPRSLGLFSDERGSRLHLTLDMVYNGP